jgi:hypothetical protein
MITITFQFEDYYGSIESFIRDMPQVPREGEMVNMCGLVGKVEKVCWYPGEVYDSGPHASVKVRI